MLAALGLTAGLVAGAVAGCFSEREASGPGEGECRFPVGDDIPGSTVVVIRRFVFGPAEVRVRAGERVTWINCDEDRHTSTADGGELAERVGAQEAGTLVALIAEYAPIGRAAAVIAAHPDVPVLRKPFGFRELYEVLCPLIGPPRAALPLSGRATPPRRRRHQATAR